MDLSNQGPIVIGAILTLWVLREGHAMWSKSRASPSRRSEHARSLSPTARPLPPPAPTGQPIPPSSLQAGDSGRYSIVSPDDQFVTRRELDQFRAEVRADIHAMSAEVGRLSGNMAELQRLIGQLEGRLLGPSKSR